MWVFAVPQPKGMGYFSNSNAHPLPKCFFLKKKRKWKHLEANGKSNPGYCARVDLLYPLTRLRETVNRRLGTPLKPLLG